MIKFKISTMFGNLPIIGTPNIVEILNFLSGSVHFTTLDLFSGYYQVALEESAQILTLANFK